MSLPLLRPLAALSLLLFAGCGDAQRMVPVTGQVFVDRMPAHGALVVLSPQNADPQDERWKEGFPRGYVDAEGRFKIMTQTEADGAPEGNYIVLVRWTGKPQDEETEDTQQLPDLFLERYATPDKSPLKAEVRADTRELPRIDLSLANGGTGS